MATSFPQTNQAPRNNYPQQPQAGGATPPQGQGQGQATQQGQQYPQQNTSGEPEALRNLIVNYIPTTVDESQLRQLFENYGPIENARIIRDRETKQSRGFGFIKYQYAMSAYNAIQYLNGYNAANKRLKVAYAQEQDAAQAQAQMQMYNPMMMGMGAYGGGRPAPTNQQRPPQQQGQGQYNSQQQGARPQYNNAAPSQAPQQ